MLLPIGVLIYCYPLEAGVQFCVLFSHINCNVDSTVYSYVILQLVQSTEIYLLIPVNPNEFYIVALKEFSVEILYTNYYESSQNRYTKK